VEPIAPQVNKQICVGFNNHEKKVFNLVQALNALFLYTQTKKESVEEYSCNFKSLWDTVEAFGGSPGVHKGLVTSLLRMLVWLINSINVSKIERSKAKEEVMDAVKAVLLISGADKRRYGRLKEQLANNYLLGTDQYPYTLEEASRILGNYQVARPSSFADRRRGGESGLPFLQRGGRGGQGCGAGGAEREARNDTGQETRDSASKSRIVSRSLARGAVCMNHQQIATVCHRPWLGAIT
jgi:hypothetical protein